MSLESLNNYNLLKLTHLEKVIIDLQNIYIKTPVGMEAELKSLDWTIKQLGKKLHRRIRKNQHRSHPG